MQNKALIARGALVATLVLFGVYVMVGGETFQAQSSGSDGGNSYIAYGTNTCASGYTAAYTGVMHVPARREIVAGGGVSMAMSDVICSAITTSQSGFNTSIISNNLLVQLDRFRALTDPNDNYPCAVCVK